jgi:hypothetical protein
MRLSKRDKTLMSSAVQDRLRYAAWKACDPECMGRCLICPAEVMSEAADEIDRLSALLAALQERKT